MVSITIHSDFRSLTKVTKSLRLMASTEGLVPITRSFLASYYDKYPFSPLSDVVSRLSDELHSIACDLHNDSPLSEGERSLVHEAECQPPHKIDENMWKNREQIEEILFCWKDVIGQMRYDVHATRFSGTLIRQQRERSERNKQAEIDALVQSGASLRDRYALLWKQQMERRKQLAQLGAATGVYKTLVKYLVGVPQVLLDFIRQLNDDQGRRNQISILEDAANIYTSELERFIKFIGQVFANSPFFITAGEAGAIEAGKNDDYKEIIVPSGKTYEVSLAVESINSYIAWDFSILQGKMNMDIGFSVEYTNSLGDKTLMLPYRRYECDQGNFCTCLIGNYKLVWDNSYSTFFKKVLRYKVDCIPPVVEPVTSQTEVEQCEEL